MTRYGRRQSYGLRSRRFVSAVTIFSLALCAGPFSFIAKCEPLANVKSAKLEAGGQDVPLTLHLDVVLNGHSLGLIAAFVRTPDGKFSATAKELRELRIEPPATRDGGELVALDSIDGLSYRYDEANQRIEITVGAKSLKGSNFAVGDGKGARTVDAGMMGAVVNYGLFAFAQNTGNYAYDISNSVTATIDGRFFGSYGTVDSSAIFGMSDIDALRLATTYSYEFTDSLISVHAGDVISGGFSWTRPIRMGGLQIRRNFGLRPDLITKPLPTLSGTAAVPSTVDVYVNNVRTYSKQVPSGPFTINRLPVVSGSGTTRMVVRDASGRETVTETPFYSSEQLLSPGMVDFSAEVGFARLNYGSVSNDYDGSLLASGSVRYGLWDTLTLAGHGEGGVGVLLGGGSIITQIGILGTLSVGASASSFDGEAGSQVFAALQGRYSGIYFNARSLRSFGAYTDLAAQTYDYVGRTGVAAVLNSVEPARASDFVSLGLPVVLTGGTVSLSYLHNETVDGQSYDVANISYSQQLTDHISMHASGFHSVNGDGNAGVYVGITVSLANRMTLSGGADTRRTWDGGYHNTRQNCAA